MVFLGLQGRLQSRCDLLTQGLSVAKFGYTSASRWYGDKSMFCHPCMEVDWPIYMWPSMSAVREL